MSTTVDSSSVNDDRGPAFKAYTIFLTVLSIASICLRIWARCLRTAESGRRSNRFWWDDWVAFVSLPVLLSQFGIAFKVLDLGFGRHIWTLPAENLYLSLKLIFAIYYVYDVALFLTKLSALLFISRIFPKHTRPAWFHYTLMTTYFLNAAWLLGIILGTTFMCKPIAKNWYPTMSGHCGSTSALYIGSAVPSVVIDFIILLMPMPILWNIKASRGRRIGVITTFALGYIVIAVSIGRLITALTSQDAIDEDLTYAGVPMIYWVQTEGPTLLLGICVPAILPLGRHLMSSYFSPMASYVSSRLNSRGSGTLGSQGDNDGPWISKSHQTVFSEKQQQSLDLPAFPPQSSSAESHSAMLRMQAQQYQYSNEAQVLGTPQQPYRYTNVPPQSIRVDSGVTVTSPPQAR